MYVSVTLRNVNLRSRALAMEDREEQRFLTMEDGQ